MNRFYVTVFVLTLISCISFTKVAGWARSASEDFVYAPNDGYDCVWTECNKPGSGPRLFHIRCKSGASSYECVYKANPHGCGPYNNHQLTYYRSLARKAGENQATACSQDPLSSNSMCTDIEFEKIVYNSPYGIAWCIEN